MWLPMKPAAPVTIASRFIRSLEKLKGSPPRRPGRVANALASASGPARRAPGTCELTYCFHVDVVVRETIGELAASKSLTQIADRILHAALRRPAQLPGDLGRGNVVAAQVIRRTRH